MNAVLAIIANGGRAIVVIYREGVEINLPTTDAAQSTELDGEQPKKKYKSSNSKNPKKTKKQKFQLLQSENGITLSPTVHSFDLWLSSKKTPVSELRAIRERMFKKFLVDFPEGKGIIC